MGSQERKKREKEARKQHILNAARTILLKKGIYSTTINQIARLSELSVGTIYLYFQNKEDIYAALQEEGMELLKQHIAQAVSEAETYSDKVRAISTAYVEFSEMNVTYYNIITYFLTTSEQFFPKPLKNRIDRFGSKILNYCSKIIDAGIEAGEFKNINSKKHIIWLWGSLNGLIQIRKMENTILHDESYRNIIKYAVENFIFTLVQDE